jgi:hypothetical protein
MANLSQWTTQDEIAFVRGLGTHSALRNRTFPPSRAALAKRYLESEHKRIIWGRIDREAVLKAARALVEE